MFTALILICANGIKTPETCFFMTNENIFPSREMCEQTIAYGITVNPDLFRHYDEETKSLWKPEDYMCVNWNSERV